MLRHLVCLAGLLATGAATAQVNLGELLDLGGKKLGPAEVQALGDVELRRQAPDVDAHVTLRADGTVAGMVHNKEGHGSSEAVGRWAVDASGRRCADFALPAFRMELRQCNYTFRLGRDLYLAASDTDLAAAVHEQPR